MGNRVFKTPIELPGGVVLPDDLGSGGGASVHAGDDPPTGTPEHGSLWIDTDEVSGDLMGRPVGVYFAQDYTNRTPDWADGTYGTDIAVEVPDQGGAEITVVAWYTPTFQAINTGTQDDPASIVALKVDIDGVAATDGVVSETPVNFENRNATAHFVRTFTPSGPFIVSGLLHATDTSDLQIANALLTVQVFRSDPVVLDNRYMVRGEAAPRSGTALFDEYPLGTSSFAYTNDTSWFYQYGTVFTTLHIDGSGNKRGFQINVTGYHDWPEYVIRRWIDSTGSWSPWLVNGSGLSTTDAVLPTDVPADIPKGVTCCATSNAGWAEAQPGTLETINPPNTNYTRQTWSCMAHDPMHMFVRRWMTGPQAWSGWVAL